MSVSRYHTIGAAVRDLRALKSLEEWFEALDAPQSPLVVMVHGRDEKVAHATLPAAMVMRGDTGLSRMQWIEFGSIFFTASTVSFMMGVVHFLTGVIVQAVLVLGSLAGLILYHRRSRLRDRLLAMALPENVVDEWDSSFRSGFAVALVTVSEELLDEAQEVFLQDGFETPLAVSQRMVL